MSDLDDLQRMLDRFKVKHRLELDEDTKTVVVELPDNEIEFHFDSDTERFDEIELWSLG